MFENLSLKAKILSGFLVVCLGLAVVAGTAWYGLGNVVSTYNKLAAVSVPNLGHISGMRARGRQVHAESIKLALYLNDPDETKKALESLAHGMKRYEAITEEYLAAPFSPGEKEVFEKIDSDFLLVKKTVGEILNVHASSDADKDTKLRSLLARFENEVRDHQASLLKLDDFHVALGDKWSKDAQDLSFRMNVILMSVAFITFIAGIMIAFIQSKKISVILQRVAENLQASSGSVSENSRLVAEASKSLADGTNEQASCLQETVSSTNEIAAMTEKTSQNAQDSLQKAELSREASTAGSKSLEEMIKAITDIRESNVAINDQIKQSNTEIQQITRLILDIEQKTKLIDDIVFQTKLLSFNVSVEAARVGEHGKGFSVVAQEMSKLADMSGKASKEISDMLSQTTHKAVSIVESNEKNINRLISVSEERIKTGTVVVENCSTVLNTIIGYLGEMYTMIRETSTSSSEQEKGISEINKAIGQIDIITTQNAQTSEQCAEAAETLLHEVENTRHLVRDLQKVVYGTVLEEDAKVIPLHEKKTTLKAA